MERGRKPARRCIHPVELRWFLIGILLAGACRGFAQEATGGDASEGLGGICRVANGCLDGMLQRLVIRSHRAIRPESLHSFVAQACPVEDGIQFAILGADGEVREVDPRDGIVVPGTSVDLNRWNDGTGQEVLSGRISAPDDRGGGEAWLVAVPSARSRGREAILAVIFSPRIFFNGILREFGGRDGGAAMIFLPDGTTCTSAGKVGDLGKELPESLREKINATGQGGGRWVRVEGDAGLETVEISWQRCEWGRFTWIAAGLHRRPFRKEDSDGLTGYWAGAFSAKEWRAGDEDAVPSSGQLNACLACVDGKLSGAVSFRGRTMRLEGVMVGGKLAAHMQDATGGWWYMSGTHDVGRDVISGRLEGVRAGCIVEGPLFLKRSMPRERRGYARRGDPSGAGRSAHSD